MRGSLWVATLMSILFSCTEKVESDVIHSEYDSILISSIRREMHYVLLSESEKLNLMLPLVDIDSDSAVSMSDLSRGKARLYFYFSKYQCGECIDRELKYINEFYTEDEIAIIAEEQNQRNLKILKKNRNMKHHFYWMKPGGNFGVSWDKLNMPVFFRISPQGSPYNIYIPKFSYPQFSKEYHETMSEILGCSQTKK